MKSKYSLLAILFFVFTFLGCTRVQVDAEFDPNETGSLILEFDNIAGSQDLKLGTEYTNAVNEKFSVNLLQYFISNIKLKTQDGREHIIPQDQSYFLVREHDKNSQFIKLNGLPEGYYTQVSFTIGVDSTRCTMPPAQRTGVLDIGNENTGKSMYWSWNSGYIFFKIEGYSPVGRDYNGQKVFFYHVGGFGGYSSPTVNNIRTKTMTFGKDRALVRKTKTPEIHIVTDVLKVFDGSTKISIATNPSSHFTAWSSNVANNYVNAFEYHHLHNDNSQGK
jgi:hypothetical protein